MTKLYSIRFALLASVSLLLTDVSHAQFISSPQYTPTTPTMVQAAPGFPTISAEQIARDVTEDYDPRTGETSLVAAPFDPFEQDSSLAASVNLQTANRPVAIDGTALYEDGAILDMKFYYNSPSDDPYDGRGYSDAAFLSGDFTPVITRDTRILECSTRVENIVYEHQAYYGADIASIYRPYRHYTGHYGFANSGFGVNLNFGSRGFSNRNFSTGRRGFSSGVRRARGVRTNVTPQNNNAVRRTIRDRDERVEARRERQENRTRTGGNTNRRNASEGRVDSRRESVRRALRGESSSRRSENRLVPGRTESNTTTRTETARTTTKANSGSEAPRRQRTRPQAQSQPRTQAPSRSTGSSTSTSTPKAAKTKSSRPKSEKRKTQRRTNTDRSNSNRSSSTRRTQKRAPTRSTRNTSSNTRPKLNFFPRDGFGVRDVVTSRSVDCAREETLRVFIPAERLDAARFDGLNLIVLDREGYETPVFIPPNYIEGFRLAATGQIRPQGLQSNRTQGAHTHIPQVQPERPIESASCPVGTILQPDGTCLLNTAIGSASYPQ